MKGRAVLLVNLGSPDSTSVKDVRRYLNQFLMDPCVIDLPWPLRRFIVSAFVLPSRPAKSAEAYQSVWRPDGAPLKVLSQKLTDKVKQHTELPVSLAMRYANPSMEQEILKLAETDGVNEILLLPLYPHYAMSSVKTAIDEAKRIFGQHNLSPKLTVHPVFYNHPDYIDALVESARPSLAQDWDHLLFSYHGVPERHIRKDDPTGNHCLGPDCCNKPSEAHKTCYRHQVFETTKEFVNKAGIPDCKWSLAFQSRLGKAKWLSPAADQTIIELAQKGVKKLLVICPAFTVDCLETLEEIGIRAKEDFIAHGGEDLTLIPCLNDDERWAKTLAHWAEQ
ncbi:ferrochelatase [Sansalvadorimonas sp. 2012CJ34-2]|uniref:Ferrochelatase n=1 Tax=Parendozoicomonas callyspongiae TaxID=2942213 RepID=A0ABT0PG29_9GAMM|nr:ferrochelatase [Sansalvadorimonas sp. 2012CJ34-2]MCL6270333.1 ferrochelatase [Sansalvadorimonas sp. 2012CJ34-2]